MVSLNNEKRRRKREEKDEETRKENDIDRGVVLYPLRSVLYQFTRPDIDRRGRFRTIAHHRDCCSNRGEFIGNIDDISPYRDRFFNLGRNTRASFVDNSTSRCLCMFDFKLLLLFFSFLFCFLFPFRYTNTDEPTGDVPVVSSERRYVPKRRKGGGANQPSLCAELGELRASGDIDDAFGS